MWTAYFYFPLVAFLGVFLVVVRADVVHFLSQPVLLEPPPTPAIFNGFSYLDTDNSPNNNWPSLVDPSTPTSPPNHHHHHQLAETTTRFSLPEIIINRGSSPEQVATNIHNEDDSIVVHNQYLPPKSPPPSTTTTTPRPILQDELNYYLPPSADRNPNNGRNLYHYPRPPIQFDEPYIEPIYPPLATPPPAQYLPPPTQPPNAYLPPTRSAANRTDNDFFNIVGSGGAFRAAVVAPLRLEMTEMKCLNDGYSGYFRTRITVQSFINLVPVFEDSLGCNHRLELSRNQILIEIPRDEFRVCGVRGCGEKNEELCAKIRFPQIKGMRTVNDAILALQCKPQEKVVSRTHALKMGVSSDSHARSIGALAQGGGDTKFRTQVGLFRRNGDAFHRPLESNGVVQLGEDLMLRTQTKQGDGWNYTRITDISMQRLGKSGEVLNTVNLVANNGCVNPSMKSVCTIPPQYEPPLGQKFGFRAVMFQGMKSGEEVVMSIRIIGCVNRNDCEGQSQCVLRNGGRIRRNLKNASGAADHVEVTKISFRVADPVEEERAIKDLQDRSLIITWSCVGIGLGFFGLIICALMIIYQLRLRRKRDF